MNRTTFQLSMRSISAKTRHREQMMSYLRTCGRILVFIVCFWALLDRTWDCTKKLKEGNIGTRQFMRNFTDNDILELTFCPVPLQKYIFRKTLDRLASFYYRNARNVAPKGYDMSKDRDGSYLDILLDDLYERIFFGNTR